MGLDVVTLAAAKKYTNETVKAGTSPEEMKDYINSKIEELIGGATADADTLKELEDMLNSIKEDVEQTGTPKVSEEDNGKFLCVVDGVWQPKTIPFAEDSTEKF